MSVVLGLILFSLYTIPLSKVIRNHPGIGFHFYTENTKFSVHLTHKNVAHAFDRLKSCLDDIKKWLATNMLKLNPDKTEFIIFGSKILENSTHLSQLLFLVIFSILLWLGVNLTTTIPYLGVSLLMIFVSCNVFKIVWLESLPRPLSTHTPFLLERLSIGCLLNTLLYLRLPYWCTSSYILIIQDILYLSLNLGRVFITHIKANLMVCCLWSHTLHFSI